MKLKLSVFFCIVFSLFAFFPVCNQQIFHANTEDYIITLGSNGIEDFYLYNSILSIYNQHCGMENQKSYLTENCLTGFENLNLDLRDKNISSLQGLNKLNLSKIAEIDLSNNNLQTIQLNQNLSSLKTLAASDNELQKFEITSENVKIENLDLSNNNLTEIDLTNLLEENAEINLNNNSFTKSENVSLPLSTYKCELYFNYINQNDTRENVFLGLQGFNLNSSMDYGTNITLFSFKDKHNVKCEIVSNSTITLSSLGDTIKPDCNTYSIKLFEEQTLFLETNLNIVPNVPTIKIVEGSKEVDGSKILRAPTSVTFESDCEIMYSINSGEFTNGKEIKLNQSGTYTIRVKAKQNGMESPIKSFTLQVSLSTSFGSTILMFVVILVIGAGVIITKMIFSRAEERNETKFN